MGACGGRERGGGGTLIILSLCLPFPSLSFSCSVPLWPRPPYLLCVSQREPRNTSRDSVVLCSPPRSSLSYAIGGWRRSDDLFIPRAQPKRDRVLSIASYFFFSFFPDHCGGKTGHGKGLWCSTFFSYFPVPYILDPLSPWAAPCLIAPHPGLSKIAWGGPVSPQSVK